MDAIVVVSHLAAASGGIVTRAQARRAGVSEHQIDALLGRGLLINEHRGVYRIASVASTFTTRCHAAIAAVGTGAVIDRWSAGMMHQLVPIDPHRPITVAVPAHRRVASATIDVAYRAVLPQIDMTSVGAIPVTTAARTIVDCAAFLSLRQLADLADEALRTRRTSLPTLRARAAALAAKGRAGSTAMASLLALHDGDVRSANGFERNVRTLLIASGLPRPVAQFEVVTATGSRFIDLAYPAALVGIEPAGWKWHSGQRQWAADIERNNELIGLGWRIIPVTWDQRQRRPRTIVRDVRGALLAAGVAVPASAKGLAAQAG